MENVLCIHCVAPISDNQRKTELPCGHRFHFACQFEHSMDTGSNSCPVCNNEESSLEQSHQHNDTQLPPIPTTQTPNLPPRSQSPNVSNYQHPPPIPPRNGVNNTAPSNNTPQRQCSPPTVRPNNQSRNIFQNGTTPQQQRPPFPQQGRPNQPPTNNGPRNNVPITNYLQQQPPPQQIRSYNPRNTVPNNQQQRLPSHPPRNNNPQQGPQQFRSNYPPPNQNPGYPDLMKMNPLPFPPAFMSSNGPMMLVPLPPYQMQPPQQLRQPPGQSPRGRSQSVAPARKSMCYSRLNCRNTLCRFEHPAEKCAFDLKCNNNSCERWHPLRNEQRY